MCIHIYIYIYTYNVCVYICIYVYVYVCICVFIDLNEGDRGAAEGLPPRRRPLRGAAARGEGR